MANPEQAIPNWVNKWLMINAGFLIFDGSFRVLRPHSLPGGCLGSTVYYGYKFYIQADTHYADPKDSFIFAQGFGNLIEAGICLLILLNVFEPVVLKKMMIMFVSVMTFYKTVLFCIYSMEPGNGGRAFRGLLAEFLVFSLDSIWLCMPAYVTCVLLQDFVVDKEKRSLTTHRNHCPSKQQSTDDTLQSADDTLQSEDDTLQSEDDTLQSADNTLQSADDTLQSADNTLQSADDTLQSADNTLQSPDDTLQSADDSVGGNVSRKRYSLRSGRVSRKRYNLRSGR